MPEGRKANKLHKDYSEYIRKCKIIGEEYISCQQAVERKHGDWRGLDHPANEEIRKIREKYLSKLRELQQEYRHIFSEEG